MHYLHAEEKYVIVHHARGEDLIEESLKSLEDEFGERFVRIHRNCLVARHEIVELKRGPDGHVQACCATASSRWKSAAAAWRGCATPSSISEAPGPPGPG